MIWEPYNGAMADTQKANPDAGWAWSAESVFVILAVDMCLAMFLPQSASLPARAGLALVFAAFLIIAGKASPSDFGLRLGNAAAGLKLSLAICAVVGFLLATSIAIAWAFLSPSTASSVGQHHPWQTETPWSWILLSTLAYPVLEECLYRGIFLPPIERRAGRAAAIVISGVVFQALHLAYGIYWPHYFFGGMLLGWVFLRSRSLIFPILLHALWNASVLAIDALRGYEVIPF